MKVIQYAARVLTNPYSGKPISFIHKVNKKRQSDLLASIVKNYFSKNKNKNKNKNKVYYNG